VTDALYTGSAGGEYGVLRFVAALDAESGEMQWQTDTLPEDEWVGASREHGCGTTWMTPTIDEERASSTQRSRIPVPTSTARCGRDRTSPPAEPSRWTSRAASGSGGSRAVRTTSGDYDAVAPRVLVRDVDVEGESMDIVAGSDKTGWVYMLDAESGQPTSAARKSASISICGR